MEKRETSTAVKATSLRAQKRRKFTGRWLSFKKSEDGAAAVEFALISIPFFLILFSILEQGMFFFANRLIDAGVYQIAREVKTKQINVGNTSEGQFRTALCAKTIMRLFKCDDLAIDVQEIASFANPADPPVNPDGTLDTTGFGFSPGGASTINIIRVYYNWPTVLDWGSLTNFKETKAGGGEKTRNNYLEAFSKQADDSAPARSRRIVGSAAFLIEP